MARYEFSFLSTPALGDQAMLCIIRRRGGRWLLPALLVAFPVVLLLLASEPSVREPAAVVGGAAVMLLLLFLLANAHRRRARDRWYRAAGDRTIHVVIDEQGIAVRSALGESRLLWTSIHRMLANEQVALLFYHGWTHLALPRSSVPPGALEMVQARIAAQARG